MAHRLVLTFDAVADEVDPRAVVDRVIRTIPQPRAVWGSSGSMPEFS
jgi:MoxR-like ATPase